MKTIEQVQKDLKKFVKKKVVDGNEVEYYTPGAEMRLQALKFLTYNNDANKYNDDYLNEEISNLTVKSGILLERCESLLIDDPFNNKKRIVRHGMEKAYNDLYEDLKKVKRQIRFMKYLTK